METRPTILPAVPRVFEKVYNGVVANGSAAPGVKGRLFRWAFSLFDEYVEAKNQGREPAHLGLALARKLVFSKVRASLDEKLGGNMRLFVSGGAPLSRKIAYFFDLLGYKVLEGYGLTETSAATCVNPPERIKIGTVGPPLPGTQVKIAQDGELLLKGPGVMKGYYKNAGGHRRGARSRWLVPHRRHRRGGRGGLRHASPTARRTSSSPPAARTSRRRTSRTRSRRSPSSARPWSMATSASTWWRSSRVAEEPARKLLTEKGVTPGTYAELCRRPELQAAVQEILDKVNAELPSYSTLKRFAVMEADFSQETGELTPSLKVKRKHVSLKFKAVLDGLYDKDERAD